MLPRLAALLFLLATSVLAAVPDTPPVFAEVRASHRSSQGVLLDRHGEPLAERRIDMHARRLEWIALDAVSPAMSRALIAAEDQRFFEHAGVDWRAMAAAAWANVWRAGEGRRVRGASTLTMQVAGLLEPALAARHGARSLEQKWAQVRAALALEQRWSKEEVLEAYLNLASYRGDLVGIDAAAQGLFAKAPGALDGREAAVLVALLRGPAAAPTVVAQRACSVAAQVGPEVACKDVEAVALRALTAPRAMAPRWDDAPHLAARLLVNAGERVRSTLDADLQRYAVATLHEQLEMLADRSVEDGAIVVLDNASGDVLAYVGSSGELSGAAQVDGVVALRQAGSTLKPFLYALALERRLLTAASLLEDSPVAITTERGLYAPQNYERDFHGLVSVRTALASSLNVPAVRTLDLVGIDGFHRVLRDLGFETLASDAEHYGLSLALGSADVDLLALANAYRTLANGGVHAPVRLRTGDPGPPAPRRLLGRDASFIVADVLADRGARATTFGLENALATRVWSAVKTGTSKDMRDNWCVGFTSRYTVGVWVGNFSGAPMRDVSGVTGAAPIWRALVHRLHAQDRAADPVVPAGVLRSRVAFEPAVESERDEWFVRGTQMSRVRSVTTPVAALPRIRYPVADEIIALDPDIPPGRQRVLLEADPVIAGLQWRLDGEVLAAARSDVLWEPVAGTHTLVLEDGAGRALSEVRFEVRGSR